MKTRFKNLTEALTFLMEGMYDTEKRIQKYLPSLAGQVSNPALKRSIKNYASDSSDQRTKLKRIFSYLLSGPFNTSSEVSAEMIASVKGTCKRIPPSPLRDVLCLTGLHAICQYKLSTYTMAERMAMRLGLERVVDLLDSVISLEKKSTSKFLSLASSQINGLEPVK